MFNNAVLKKFLIIVFFGVFYCFNCFAQTSSLSYHTPNNFTVGTAIKSLTPTITGFKATSFTISPALPDSLKIDPKNGTISGKPINPAVEADYIVTAKITIVTGKTNKDSSIKSAPLKIKINAVGSNGASSSANATCCKVSDGKDIGFGGWVLVLLPVALFIILLVIFLFYIGLANNDKKYNLGYALSESAYATVTELNKLYDQPNLDEFYKIQKINTSTANLPITTLLPPTITITDNKYRPSMSRLIALLTSTVSLAVGLGLSSFFIYSYLRNGCEPDIGKLSTVLISLGIGVVPYAFNKVTGIFGGGAKNPTGT